jgi:hypothetical protein
LFQSIFLPQYFVPYTVSSTLYIVSQSTFAPQYFFHNIFTPHYFFHTNFSGGQVAGVGLGKGGHAMVAAAGYSKLPDSPNALHLRTQNTSGGVGLRCVHPV